MLTPQEQFKGCLSSSVPHVRSVRKDYMIHQRHLPGGFLKAQGNSTFAIVNPECPIRPKSCDKKKSSSCTRDSVPDDRRLLSDVISRLKCNLCQNL